MNVMRPPPKGETLEIFVQPSSIDFQARLPAPPDATSLVAKAELIVMRQVQLGRTAEQVAWAKAAEKDGVFDRADLLGPWFKTDRLPATTQFFNRLGASLRALDGAAKKTFQRARPTTVDPTLRPCVAVPASTSYPSGSATQAYVWAELLAEVFPAKRAELLARAEHVAWARVLGGVHFPSDLEGGRRLAEIFLNEARKSPAFQSELTAMRTELLAAAK